MNIETAQHRLLEVLVDTHRNRDQRGGEAGDPLLALSIGVSTARRTDTDLDPASPLGPVLAAFADLILAVRSDAHEPRLDQVSAVRCWRQN